MTRATTITFRIRDMFIYLPLRLNFDALSKLKSNRKRFMGMNETRPFSSLESSSCNWWDTKSCGMFQIRDKRFLISSESFTERVHPIWIRRQILSRPAAQNEDTPMQISCREVRKELA